MDNIDQALQTPTLRISKDFPEGYGDILLQSSDAENFHFPSFLLAYSSPVFKDMFELAPKANKDVGEQTQEQKRRDPIVLSEDAVTIRGFLLHIDPLKIPLPIRKGTIKPLLEAARKYQLSTVLQWFEREVEKAVNTTRVASQERKPLIEQDPLFVLSLATEYGAQELIPKAILAAVNGAPMKEGDILDDQQYRLIHSLRQKRVEKYLSNIDRVARVELAELSKCACGATYSGWLIDVTKVILKEPLWESFEASIKSHDKCLAKWSILFTRDMDHRVLKSELCNIEHELPKLL
jgi:hypothetical protein